jgi:selenoprotein W-related protein
LAEELTRELGIESQLVKSSGGVFEVEYGDDLIFSKKEIGRFPDIGEVVSLIKKKS